MANNKLQDYFATNTKTAHYGMVYFFIIGYPSAYSSHCLLRLAHTLRDSAEKRTPSTQRSLLGCILELVVIFLLRCDTCGQNAPLAFLLFIHVIKL